MKSILILSGLLLSVSLLAQTPSNNIIKDYGVIWDLEEVVKPAKDQPVKMVIDLKTSIIDPEQVNRGLNNVARMLNLHAAGGISDENLHFAVVIHGGATPIILNDEGYRKKYGVANPNVDLLQQLEAAGVEVYVCAQSMIARDYPLDQVDSTVDKALSMLTIVTEKMNQGHHLMVFN